MNKPSRYPQNIDKNAWYYEERGHIEVIVDAKYVMQIPEHTAITIKIPAYRLRRSLKRMGKGRA